MLTKSQELKRQEESLSRELAKLDLQRRRVEETLDSLNYELNAVQKEYKAAYKEEKEARRSFVPGYYGPTVRNPLPDQEWRRWNSIAACVVNHPKFNPHARDAKPRHWRLLLNLSRFAREMVSIACVQTFNPRNRAPYLP